MKVTLYIQDEELKKILEKLKGRRAFVVEFALKHFFQSEIGKEMLKTLDLELSEKGKQGRKKISVDEFLREKGMNLK